MDLPDSACAFACAQQRVAFGGLAGPAEATPALCSLPIFLFLIHESRHIDELLELLVFAIGEDRVGAVAFFKLLRTRRLLQGFAVFGVADFFYGELGAPDFKNVSFVDLVVLSISQTMVTKFEHHAKQS